MLDFLLFLGSMAALVLGWLLLIVFLLLACAGLALVAWIALREMHRRWMFEQLEPAAEWEEDDGPDPGPDGGGGEFQPVGRYPKLYPIDGGEIGDAVGRVQAGATWPLAGDRSRAA
jgi:hypothetical protein